jgi:subtilisin family serine protease
VSAHAISQGEGTTVAVVDTGAQLDHPALVDNFGGVKRYDFVDNDKNPSDRPVGKDDDCDGETDEMVGHGTHVAGIVDVTAPAAKIMPLRVLDTEGYGDVFTIAKAVNFAAQNHADVINLSLGSPSRSKLLQEVIKDATANGVLVAAAAGNANSSLAHYPAAGNGVTASADGLVAVTSVNMYEQKSYFANYGTWVDIAAPGEGIRSAFPVSKYAYWSGTSMATPFVSGQAALIHAVYGSVDAAGVEKRIRCSARSLFVTDPIYAAMLGAGRADVGASLSPGACS